MKRKIKVGIYNNAPNKEEGLIALEKCKEYVANNENMELVKCYEDYYPTNVEITQRQSLINLLKESRELRLKLIVICSVENSTNDLEEFKWLEHIFGLLKLESFYVAQKFEGGKLLSARIISNALTDGIKYPISDKILD